MDRIRQYKICLSCKQANPRKNIKLHLNDRFCRKCGEDISGPAYKTIKWDLVEEVVKSKNPYSITWIGTDLTLNNSGVLQPYTPWAQHIVMTNTTGSNNNINVT